MKKFSKKQWIKFSIAAVLYLLFTLWMQNAWLLLGLIVLVDIFLTGYIPWGAWKRTKNPQVRNVLEWVDDILFALVAVYFINIFIFQNYQIPSSSLEKSLLVGDYLFVSKLSYGPRVPNTPVAFPLVQNTLPFFNCKSYLDWPEWDYKRVKGLGHVKRNDIVVFNFPAGDTVALKVQNPDYYHLVEQYGREAILLNKADFGDVIYRPVDKRENYVKRCIGMPGDTIDIVDGKVYLNGFDTPLDEPYLHEPMEPEEPQHYEVPDGCYFMLGDNRNYSNDARRWTHKYVKRDKLVAKVLFQYFPKIQKLN